MLVSLKWLKDYIDIDLSPKELADKLTMVGLEVDSIQEIAPGFRGVVVAKILAVRSHPNADKLSLCDIDAGEKSCTVVCGAPNVRVGMITAFARIGAALPGGYTIKHAKIRGEESEGMLCSAQELGIGDDASGIMDLPESLMLGEDLASALKLNDTVFEIGITPNRSDCLSIIGIAREIAAITGLKLHSPDTSLHEEGQAITDLTSVQILDPDLCPRYTARMIRDVKIGPTPAWMRMRLEAVGLRSINNIVDITNFVMMELGQPLHAFDYRFLEEGRIVVRRASEGEEFVSLDGKTRALNNDTLMICDGVKPVAVAGIMGGLNSEVQDDTHTILLESAYFSPSSIRRTSKRMGMGTDAAYRFERGIDPQGVVRALDRAAKLMAELAQGKIVKGYIDQYPLKIEGAKDIRLRPERVRRILGSDLKDDEIVSLLAALGMSIQKSNQDFVVTPPSYRVDITIEMDLIEEIARLYGYDRIPETFPDGKTQTARDMRQDVESKIRTILTGSGFTELINYSFTTPDSVDLLQFPADDERRKTIKILNPLSEELSIMRTSLIYGLLDALRKNLNVGNENIRIFEKAKIFIASGSGELPGEREKLCGLLSGLRYQDLWNGNGEEIDFFDIKGCVEKLLNDLKFNDIVYVASGDQPFLHPGRSCRATWQGNLLGYLGEVHPDVMNSMDIKGKAFIFELDFNVIMNGYKEKLTFKAIPRFPPSFRDVSLLVSRDLESMKILNLAESEHEELLEKIEIFDVYMGKNIPENSKSIALRLTYRSPNKTLTDDEVNQVHMRLIKIISDGSGAKIRGE